MTFSRRRFLATTLPVVASPAILRRDAHAGQTSQSQSQSSQTSQPAPGTDRVNERQMTAPPEKRLLATRCPPEAVRRALVPRRDWRPYPTAADRAAWQEVPAAVRASLVADAEPHLGQPWPLLPATLFLDFVRTGNRVNYETAMRARRARLRQLALAECAEGKGRFLDEVANGVWATCEETYWGFPAHVKLQRRGAGLPDATEPTIDLFAAEAANVLAWTHYLLGPALDSVSPRLPERIAVEIDAKILTVYHDRDDLPWMGFNNPRPVNNWNPWINSNVLACALLIEPDAERRARLASKVVTSLDRFVDAYPDDGACDEGPSYWGHAGASLFDALDLLHAASNGRLDAFDLPLVREIGRYIYRAHVADDWYVNFADASARIDIPGDVAFRYGQRIGDPKLQGLGAWAASHAKKPFDQENLGRALATVVGTRAREREAALARQPLPRDVWLPGVQVMCARVREGSPEGFYVAAQGGHNAENHNHNDVGNFMVFLDGRPALVDVGVETYSAKTFSPQRYEIWTMQSAYHNCPTINGMMQGSGLQHAARDVAYDAGEESAALRMDLAGAYPAQAGVERWLRTIRLHRRRNEVEVTDACTFARDGNRVALTLMTPNPVRQAGGGALVVSGDHLGASAVRVTFDPALKPRVEEIAIDDARLGPIWGPRIYRILLEGSSLSRSTQFVVRVTRDS